MDINSLKFFHVRDSIECFILCIILFEIHENNSFKINSILFNQLYIFSCYVDPR